jgi:hypothetical protein
MSEKSEYYTAYEHYSGVLRTWLVAYGIGAPVVVLTNESLWQTLRTNGDSSAIGVLFMSGVALQVLLAALNKAIMWGSYLKFHSEFRVRKAHNKSFLSDQCMLSCLLLTQKPRQHTLVPEQGRYVLF